MGDWGPAFAHTTAPTNNNGQIPFRCEECGMRLPGVTCSFCGGRIISTGGGGTTAAPARPAAAAAPPSLEEVEEVGMQIIQAIIPTALLEEAQAAANAHTAAPTDKDVLDELPLVKIEPYVSLTVTRGPPKGFAAAEPPPSNTPSREQLAEAAERRRSAEAVAAATSAAPSAEPPVEEEAPPPVLECRATGSAFGTPFNECGDGLAAPLVIADPRDGASEFKNAAALKGSIAVLWRGTCSFVDKVRRAQQAGCVAAVVVQGDGQKWPFTMSDTAGKGVDLLLPSLMVSPSDGVALLRAVDEARAGGGATVLDVSDAADATTAMSGGHAPTIYAHACARDHHTSCAVCLQEFLAEEMAVELPCMHRFHEACIRTWLEKQHTCPNCRTALPTRAERASPDDGAGDEQTSPVRWMEFAAPRGSQPMPASGMYT